MSDTESSPSDPDPAVRLLKARWASLLLVILIAIVIAQNAQQTGLDLRWLKFDSVLWFGLLMVTVAGFVVGLLTARRRARLAC